MAPRAPPQVANPERAWGALLERVVDDDGLVDYDRLERNRDVLDAYIASFDRPDAVPKNSRKRYAFWLNAYNALVMFQVLERGRPASVDEVGRFTFFAWTSFAVGHGSWSLQEIEDEGLRQRFQDPRVHGALNCASMSCPPLSAELYSVPGLDEQLERQMRAWIADDARGVQVGEDEAVFSAIFEWYAEDFSFWTGNRDLCSYVADYAKGPKRKQLNLLAEQGCPHRFADYDWALNQAKP